MLYIAMVNLWCIFKVQFHRQVSIVRDFSFKVVFGKPGSINKPHDCMSQNIFREIASTWTHRIKSKESLVMKQDLCIRENPGT